MIRVVKLALISAVVLFCILTAISLMIPSTVRISRAVDIEAERNEVYPLLADTTKWKSWNDLKNDRITIQLKSADSNLIHSSWSYGGRTFECFYRLEKIRDVTVVNWYFDVRLKWYPWEKFASITFEKQFGPHMESSLVKLKDMVRKTP
jgi:hypothetical protein